jgi:hypothetical protein
VEVPAGTIVRAASGGIAVRFVISPSVTVPAGFGATAEARVRALEPGPVGNVGPNQINLVEGPLAFALRVSNPEPLSGGKMETVPVVTAEDQKRVRETLLDQLRQQGYAQMRAGLDPQDCVLPSTLQVRVLLESYDRLIGEQADSLRGEIRAQVTGYKVIQSDVGAMALIALSRRVPPDSELAAEGFTFSGCDQLQAKVETGPEGTPRILLTFEAQGRAVPRLSIPQIRHALRGRSPGGARSNSCRPFPSPGRRRSGYAPRLAVASAPRIPDPSAHPAVTLLAVVMVTWNVREWALRALHALEAALDRSGLPARIWVVDNASTDGTVEAIRRAFPSVELIANDVNRGFAAANNQALRAMGFPEDPGAPRYVWLLNPDTEVQGRLLRCWCVLWSRRPGQGFAGPG